MKGGKVMWFVDAVSAEIDSLRNKPNGSSVKQLNLEDMLLSMALG